MLLPICKRAILQTKGPCWKRGQATPIRTKLHILRPHFVVCANVLITPHRATRSSILRNIHHHLTRGGHLMLVVPSTESSLYADQRLVQWYRCEGRSAANAWREGIAATAASAADLLDGIIKIEGVPTKHYLREEAVLMLESAGFEPVSVKKGRIWLEH